MTCNAIEFHILYTRTDTSETQNTNTNALQKRKLITYFFLLFCVSPDSSVYQAVSTDFCAAVVLLQLSALQGSLELVSSI